MHHVVTLIASAGNLLELPPFVTILGEPSRTDWLEDGRAVDLYYPQPIDNMLRSTLQQISREMRIDCFIKPAEGR